MDKKDIISQYGREFRESAASMTSKQEFISLLGRVYVIAHDKKARPFSKKRIDFLCNSNMTKDRRYRSFSIPKKSGGVRTISAPSKSLKSVLKALNIVFECVYTPSESAMGFTSGKSIVTNAAAHAGMNYVLNMDLKDFFPSISQARVWKRLQLKPFNFSQEIASVAAGLCCMQKVDEDGTVRRILPQGAPTSPILTNAICDKLDRRLRGVASHYGVKYTRYADDITFSSMHNVYQKDGEFLKEVERIITEQGFTINEAKTRLQKRGDRQEVTGLIVCEKPNVSREYVRNLRMMLHVWEKFGYNKAYARFVPEYLSKSIRRKTSTPPMIEVIRGRLMYLKMVKGETSPVFIALNNQFQFLIKRDAAKQKVKSIDETLTYVFTHRLSDFEDTFSTKLVFKQRPNGKPYATCNIAGQQLNILISASLANTSDMDTLKRSKKVLISLVKTGAKSFWLIRKGDYDSEQKETKLAIKSSRLLEIWKEKGLDAAIEANSKALLNSSAASIFNKLSTAAAFSNLTNPEAIELTLFDDSTDNIEFTQ